MNLSPNVTFGQNYFTSTASLSPITLNANLLFKAVSINKRLMIFRTELFSNFKIIWATFEETSDGIIC